MNYLNRVLWVFIPLLMTSCLFPDDESIEEDALEEVQELQAEQMTPDLIGTWMVTSVEYTSNTTSTEDEQPTFNEVTGVGTELNYTIIFTSEPDEVIGEGIYSLELDDGQENIEISRGHNIISSATWTYEGDLIIFVAGGKTIEATVTNLTEDTLNLAIVNETTTTFNGVVTEKTVSTIYEFIKQ